ncbi:MAG TPA: acylphosphatase [Pirellulales bacterium]|nr:acylphosphatase [Pirellulales bacterium]
MSKTERREIHYRGRVQGVGFRFTTREIAERFEVAGFVENLSDGRVHLVVEGDPAELDRFLAAVAQRLDRYIEEVDDRKQSPDGEFDGLFTIRR